MEQIHLLLYKLKYGLPLGFPIHGDEKTIIFS